MALDECDTDEQESGLHFTEFDKSGSDEEYGSNKEHCSSEGFYCYKRPSKLRAPAGYNQQNSDKTNPGSHIGMPDLQDSNERVLAACKNGDLRTLETLFQELNIGPDQPQQDWGFEKGLTENEHTPSVIRMVHHAIQGRQSDTLSFLWSKFPGTSFAGGPIASAIRTGDSELVKTVCKLDPAAPNSASGHSNVLALACASENLADVVRVLLENGADPNRVAEHIPPYSDISYAVTGHLPLSTFEQFFDAGYHCNDVWCMIFAIRHGRYDVVELLFTRGKDLPIARYETQEKLLGLALEQNDDKMADLIRRLYPVREKTSLMDTLMGKFQR